MVGQLWGGTAPISATRAPGRPGGTSFDLPERAATTWPSVSTPGGPATPIGVWRVCDSLGGTDGARHRAVYREDAGRRHSRVFVKKASAKIWLAVADRARGLRVDPRGGALPFGTGPRPGSRPARSARPAARETSAVPQPPEAGVRGPAAQGPDADADPDVRRPAVRPPGAQHGAARARAAVLGHASIVMTMDRTATCSRSSTSSCWPRWTWV